ncbi:MAG: DUF3892 domain-containing protein [Terracidiphilus sp.]|jgi:hypothetical protein
MPRYRVSCTQKREKHEHIVSLGCYGPGNTFHQFSEAEVIDRIENQGDTFYSERPDGHVAEIIVEHQLGEKFLKTRPDGERPNNLDWLPDCPAKHKVIAPPRNVVPAASHGSVWQR